MNCTIDSKKPLSPQVATHLKQNYIAISIEDQHYMKIGKVLPEPSHVDFVTGRDYYKHILIYVIDGFITSPNQYRWISNIKLGIKDFIFVPFDFVDDLCISNNAEITNTVYTINELSQAFKAQIIIYPKIMYLPIKKQLYRHLCWYGARLIHQRVFTKEALISAGLLMNKKLTDKYSNKDLHKKALGAYIWLVENMNSFKVGLSDIDLKQAHRKGATITNAKQTQTTKQLIDEAIATGDYTKPNGKVNQTKLSKALGVHRTTIIRHLQ